MSFQLNFDASQVAPSTGAPDPVPSGWYDAAIEKSEMKPTSKGDGSAYLELMLGILSGKYQGQKLWARLNLRNANTQAMEIAYRELSAICHAVGHLRVADSSELHGRPMKVKVQLIPAEGTYGPKNEIKAWRNASFQPDNVGGDVAAPVQGFTPPPVQVPGGQPPPASTWQQPPAQQFAPPVQQPWQQGGQPQQPWQQAPAAQQAPPATPPVQQAPPQQAAPQQGPAGFNPQQQNPPWARPQGA
jgi:hypothetical protein